MTSAQMIQSIQKANSGSRPKSVNTNAPPENISAAARWLQGFY